MAQATEKVPQTNGAADDVPTEEEGFRVYIAGLPLKVTEEEVRTLVSKSGGEIVSVSLPRVVRRRRAIAFVGFKTQDQANKVVEDHNDTEYKDSKISVQVAKSREETAELRKERDEQRKAAREAKVAAGEEDEDKDKKKRTPRPRRRAPEPGEEEANGEKAEGDKGARKPRARKPAAERPTPVKKLQLTGEKSKSTIFVANLPYNLNDEGLAEIFTNLSIRVKSATVVRGLRKRPGVKPFRGSKGFGFVEVEDAGQQEEAVSKVDGTLVNDRKITAKIANEMAPIEQEEVAAAEAA